jgi:diguanylate cyclase (GGDEF)-like protein
VSRGAIGADDPLTVLARKHGIISDSSDVDIEETPLERFARAQEQAEQKNEKTEPPAAKSVSTKQKKEDPKPVLDSKGRKFSPFDPVLPFGINYRDVLPELEQAGHGIAEQARDIVRPGGVKRAAKGLVHGIVDPIATLSDVAFTDPVVRARRRDARDLEVAEAARRSQTGEYSEDVAESAVKGDQRRQLVKEIMSVPQVGAMVAAPGISTGVRGKVAEKVGEKFVGRLVARLAGESAAGATFGATMDPEHPLAGAAEMALIGPVLGEGFHAAGKATRGVSGVARDVVGKMGDRRVKQLETELAAETDRRASAERAADVDELTGIANKRAFKKALPTAESDANTAIVRFDVNGFKGVNDAHGHAAGDQALVEIPSSLKKAAADLGIPDRVFRVGGDEFAVIVPKEKAAAFRDLAEELYGIKEHGSDVRTSISGGIGLTDAAADAAAMTRKHAQKAAQGIRGREDLGGATITPPETPAPAATPLEQLAEQHGIQPSTSVFSHPTEKIEIDPSRFQFKVNVNEKGVTRGLSSVEKYNQSLAGTLSVWKDPADGKTYIVNGHHRLDLAKRTNTGRVNVQFIDAKDASEARAQGALQNIAEGQGTPLDAAKFFRETKMGPEVLKAEGVELTGRIAKAGLSLSKLEPDVFAKVATGKISENHGAAIGSMLDLPEQQRAAANLIENSPKKLTDAQAAELVRQVRAAGSEKVAQDDLFGSDSEGVSLIYNRAEIASAIKAKLAADKRLFGYVAKEGRAGELARGGNQIDVETSGRIAQTSAVLEEAFDREAHAAGDVGRAITEAARRVANGEKLKSVVDEIYDPIREAVHSSVSRSGATRGSAIEEGSRIGESAAAERAGSGNGETPDAVKPRTWDVEEKRPSYEEAEAPADAYGFLPGEKVSIGGEFGVVDSPPWHGDQLRVMLVKDNDGSITRLVDHREARPLPDDTPLDYVDPNQSALFSPQDTDLFGNRIASTAPEQTSLLGDDAGSASTRSLSQAERAARSEIERLREQLPGETDPRKRVAAASRIAELERLVNRDKAITAEELGARAAGESLDPDAPPVHDQESLFAPATRSGPLRRRISKALGRKPSTADDVKALISITRNLEKAVGATVRQGRFLAAQRRAMGVFFTKSESIRVRRFDHVDTVAHEIGHFISKRHLGNPTRRAKAGAAYQSSRIQLPSAAKDELVQMGQNLYGSRKPAGGYGEEGIAEYFSFYVTEPHRLPIEAPTFDAFMRANVFPKEPWLLEALDQARSDFAANKATTAHGRVDAMLSVNERVRNMPTARGITTAVIDDLHEFKLAVDELGGERDPARNAYTLARLSRGDAGAAEEMIQRGIFDYVTRERTTRGIEEILGEIPRDRIQAFRRYLAAERTLEVAGRGVNSGIEVKDALEIKAELEPEFGQAAAELWDISNKLIDYRRDAGLLTEADAELIKEKNQRRVGFYRVFDESEKSGGGGTGRGFGRNSSGIQKMKGSARRIVDPLESLITDVYRTIHQSHTHAVLHELVSLAKRTDGGAKVAEILTEKPQHVVQMPISRIIDQLVDLGFEIPKDMPDAELLRLSSGILEHFEENRTAGPRESKDMVIPYVENGTRYWVALKDRRLFNSIAGLDRQQLPMWARILTAPTRTLRAGATLTLEFIGRNPVRDAWTAAIYSKAGFKAPGYDFARGMFSLLKRDELYQRWRIEGGDNAAMLGLDRTAIQRSLESFLRSGPERLRDVVIRPLDTLRLVSSAFENATRIGEFKSVYEKALAEGMAEASAAKEGAFAARDITIDFGKAGVQGRLINEIVAFFNASLQSQVKMVKELRERPLAILPRLAASITLPSIGLYLLQRNDPAYREIPRWEKDLFWIWVQRGDDGEVSHIWRVPKPFELGVLFGSVPERILEYIETQDPSALDNITKSIVQTTSPGVWPTGVQPLVENWANKSWFRDRPIVPRGVEQLPAEFQSTKYSSETARALGDLFGYSPAKIDNLVRGWTGGLGSDYAVPIADAGIRTVREAMGKEPLAPRAAREGNLSDRLPGLRGFTVREPGASSESLEQMYRRFDSAESKRQRWKDLLEAGKREEAKAYLESHRAEIVSVVTTADAGANGPLRVAHTTVGKLRDAARQLETAPIPAEERRIRVREIYDAMIQTARNSDEEKRPKDAVQAELEKIGMAAPADPYVRNAVERALKSPEYLQIDSIAAHLVATDPKWQGRSKKSLAAELKRAQIEGAVPALRRR